MKYILITVFAFCSSLTLAQPKDKKYYNITEIGYLTAIGKHEGFNQKVRNTNNAYRLRTQFGKFITPEWSAGLGIGLDGYDSYNTMPLFADVHYYLADKPWFSFLDLGYSIGGASFRNGGMINLGMGYRKRGRKSDVLISAGYNMQQIKNKNSIYLQSIAINFGLLF